MDPLRLSLWGLLLALALLLLAIWHALALMRSPGPMRRVWICLTVALCFMVQQNWATLGWLTSTGIYDLGQAGLSLAVAILMFMVAKGLRRQFVQPPES